jgi:hypothetical protein
VRQAGRSAARQGDAVALAFDPGALMLFDRQHGQRLQP